MSTKDDQRTRLAELEARLQVLEDTNEIRNLKSRYAELCDDNYNPPKCSPFYHDQTLVPNVPVRNRWTDLHVDRAFLDFGSSPWAQV